MLLKLDAFSHYPFTIMPGAMVDDSAIIGERTFIGHNVVIEASGGKYPQTVIGRHVCIQHLCTITAGIVIEDDVFLGPCVCTLNTRHICWGRDPVIAVRNPPIIRRGARIGGGAVIMPGVDIGEEAEIGAGSVVTKSCKAFSRFIGNPARWAGDIPDGERYAR
jgi:acetyltransferase-like isoleucine patch superfamily enzyme